MILLYSDNPRNNSYIWPLVMPKMLRIKQIKLEQNTFLFYPAVGLQGNNCDELRGL